MNRRRSRWCVATVSGLLVWPVAVLALTPLKSIRYTPDITVVLGGATVTPQNVAEDNLAGSVTLVNAGTYPNGTDIIAYDHLANGDQLLAFDVDITLPGGLTVRPGDVVRLHNSTYTLEFDANANNIPAGVMTDALRSLGPNNLLLSFDTTVAFPTFTADDEDIVQIRNGVPSLFFDGSAHGVPPELDLDALDGIDRNGHLLMSFDGSGTIAGITFDDEDVLEFAPESNTWSLAYDGSVQHAEWAPADMAALSVSPLLTSAAVPPIIQGSVPGPGGIGGQGDLFVGATRVFGIGTVHAIPGDSCIQIYSVGANGVPDNPPGSVDDELLGTGGTDATGSFVDATEQPGIGLSRALGAEERLFAVDACANLVGAVARARVPAPALSTAALVLTAALLLFAGVRRQRRAGR
jgi:hypothetical protein